MRNTVDGVRLGADRKRVIAPDGAESKRVELESVPKIDWPRMATDLRLDRTERAVFMRVWRDSQARYRAFRELGLSQHEGAKVYAQIVEALRSGESRKLVTFGASNSRSPAFRDRLPSGARPWALSELTPEFAEIMLEEKYIGLISQRDPESFRKNYQVCPIGVGAQNMKTIEQLNKELVAERAKLLRVGERAHRAHLVRSEAESALSKAQRELKDDGVAAVLEERESPNPQLRAKLSKLHTELAQRESEYEAALTGQRIQAETVSAIEGELGARRIEAFHAEFDAPAREARALVEPVG